MTLLHIENILIEAVNGEIEPVVLIHGVGMRSAAWEPQIRSLCKTHRVIALDLPEHGGSDSLPANAQLPDFVAWLHTGLKALNTGPVSLVGQSMGALIAGGFAINHSEMVTRVALLNGVFRRDEKARAAVLSRVEEIRAGTFDIETPLARWFADSKVDQPPRQHVSNWLTAINIDSYATTYIAFAHGDATYADRFSEIKCPLLAMTGDSDLNSSPTMSEAMAKTAQNGTSLIFEGHRHMLNLTAPDRVNAALLNWLNTSLVTNS